MTERDRDTKAVLFRLISRSFMQDPYPRLEELRTSGSAVAIENNGMRMWVVTGDADARAALTNPQMKKDLLACGSTILAKTEIRPERRPRLPRTLRRNLLDRDDPDHARLRTVIGTTFGAAAARAMVPKMQRLAEGLLDAIEVGVPVDLNAEFARPLSVTIIADELGIPDADRAEFPIWENDILTSPDIPRIEDAGRAFVSFARKQLAQKESRPADDLLTRVIQARDAGLISDDEAVSTITILLTGGLEPASAISNGVLTLLRHPAELAKLLEDPELMPGCIDEILRYESPFRMLTPRFSEVPVAIGDTVVPAHELILISAAAANRDPGRFPDPGRFDITRGSKDHLSFGKGVHRCLGAQLGWLQVAVALTALFDRFPGIRLLDAGEYTRWRAGMFMRRLETLPVVLAP